MQAQAGSGVERGVMVLAEAEVAVGEVADGAGMAGIVPLPFAMHGPWRRRALSGADQHRPEPVVHFRP